MIVGFKCEETEKIFNGFRSRKIPIDIQRTALRKLDMINSSTSLRDLKSPPANRLKELHGKRKGRYSVRINDKWRICFSWMDGNAYEVEIVDYH